MHDDNTIPQHDWEDPFEVSTPKARPDVLPHVDEALIKHLRERREWMDKTPDPSWDDTLIQRNIGANAVLLYLEQLLEEQRGAPV